MIERDLLSRREKARNIKQLSLSSWRWMGKEGECSDKYIGTVSLPWPRWHISDPWVQKLRFAASSVWHYVFSGFSEILSILETPFFAKTRRDTEKHKNYDGCGPRNKFWPFFRNPDFDLDVANLRPTMWKPHFSCNSGHFCTSQKKPASHPIEPRRRCHIQRAKMCVLNNLIFGMVPQDHARYFAHRRE